MTYRGPFLGNQYGPPRTTEERFWPKVAKTADCWEWTARRNPKGYGQTTARDGRGVLAHRLSWELHFGPIPVGMLVCHHCDNPPCVRPDHLFLGTRQANARDSVRKGRQTWQQHPDRLARGERVGGVRLTEDRVREIRARRSTGATYRSLGDVYGVSPSTIVLIIHGKTWRHVA